MSTRSFIAMKVPSGYKGVYCHWDGYLSNNGKILLEHYSNYEKLSNIIEMGDISSLGEEIGTKHNFDGDRPTKQTTFYKRDREEINVDPKFRKSFHDITKIALDMGCEYFYLFENRQWKYAIRGKQRFGLSNGSSFSKFSLLTEEKINETQQD